MKVVKFIGLVFIAAAITWSCNQNTSGEQKSTEKKQSQSPTGQSLPTGEKDQYGRNPGDQHYGHDHAPADNQLKTPTNSLQTPTNTLQTPTNGLQTPAGGPDKFGRNPGDQHYGHDHE